jgi:putative membrane protein
MPGMPSLARLRPSDPSWAFLRRAANREIGRNAILTVEGREYLPPDGPVVIAARHYHHLLDGCALFATIDRPAHIVVGLDWAEGGLGRVMAGLCTLARWPVVQRSPLDGPSASPAGEAGRFRSARAALGLSTALLGEGRVLIVFPEGYPNIDPHRTPKTGDAFLPFQPGLLRIVRTAEAAGISHGRVPVVPVGFCYERVDPAPNNGPAWRIAMTFGPPRYRDQFASDAEALAAIEADVRRLSGGLAGTTRA